MPDAGTAFDGSVWVASTSAIGLGMIIVIVRGQYNIVTRAAVMNF